MQQVVTIQRAWRANVNKIRMKRIQKQRMQDHNILFKGEFALTNDDQYEKYYDSAADGQRGAANSAGEADLGSLESDSESQMVSLSMIQGVDEEQDMSTSLVDEFKIKAKKASSLKEQMLFLSPLTGRSGVRCRTSRLGADQPQTNFESQDAAPATNAQMAEAPLQAPAMPLRTADLVSEGESGLN